MNVFLRFCFSAAGIFAGMAIGSWVVNKANEQFEKCIDRQLEREEIVNKEEEED